VKRTDDFRARAVECDKVADEAEDLKAKRILHEAARNWRVVAEHAKHFGW
jgi:hypothetical protein